MRWLSKRLDWPNSKLVAHAPRAGFTPKTLQHIYRARNALRAQYGLGKLQHPDKSHPKQSSKKKPPKKKKQPEQQQQLSALMLKKSRLRKLIFEIGWDEAREVFHEFEDIYGQWGER